MLIDTDTLTALLDAHYDVQPLSDYDRALLTDQLIDALPDGHPDVELTRSGVWRGTLAEWLEVGPGLVQRVPLVRVELMDREPKIPTVYDHVGKGRIGWWPWNESVNSRTTTRGKEDLPHDWFEESQQQAWIRYDTRELALDDASRRAIAWARSKAKETA